MVTASVQRLTISWPTAWVSSRGAVVLSGPVSRIEAKTLSQPYDSAAIAPDDQDRRRNLRHRMLYRHACPLGPGNGSRRSSGATLAAGVGTACHPHTCGRSWSNDTGGVG